jgi:FtsP/CotA-like multicopper oxidase with cupredoxin domain
VPEAGTYTVHFVNDGAIDHDLTFEGQPTQATGPGEMVMFEVTIPEGGTTFRCTVPGHADGGMTGSVTVAGVGGGGLEDMTAEEMRDVDAAVTARFPEETSAHGGQPLEPEILADGTKVFELTASIIDWEVEKGHFVEAWAYNEMVPGPEIRVQLGDRVRIVLHNELEAPTTLHSHGLIVPNAMDGVPAITQEAILPGESFTYEFTVRNAGSHMYHSHFMAQRQVPMGLLGAFVVEDPSEPAVDLDQAMILNDGPLGFTIDGKGFPATVPIVATQGQLIRVRYMNEGLQIHPMHLHGIPQQVIARDGFMLAQPYYEDTVLVAPGQRVDVLIRASELGVWAFHCHILSHAESDEGMFGMVTALIVNP